MPEEQLTVIFGQKGADAITGAIDGIKKAAEQLKTGLQQVGGANITKLFDDLKDAFQGGASGAASMGSMVQMLQGGVSALGTPLGIAAGAVGAFTAILEKSTGVLEETYVQMRNLSAITGTSIEETNVLSDAFKLMGFDSGALNMALFRLSMEVEQGGKRLGAYGISVRDTEGHLRATGDVFEDTIKKIGEIGDAAQRNAVLMQLFGRAGRELAPIFQSGGATLDEFKAKARDVGILTKEDSEAAMEARRSQAALKDAFEDMWIVIGRQLLPVLEAGVNALNFFVQAITAVIGITVEWVKWMATSKDAVDPLSISVKALAGAVWLLGKGIEYVKSFGKFVADIIVPPVGGPGGAPEKKPAAAGPIVTPDDIQEQTKLRDAQLKIEQRFNAEMTRMTSTRTADVINTELESIAKRLQLAQESTAKLIALTDDPVKREKLQQQLNLQTIQLEGEKNLALLKLREAQAADEKRLIEQSLQVRRQVADEEMRIIQTNKESELRLIDRVHTDEETKIKDRMTVEIGAARDTAAVKKATITEEITKLTTLAAMYQDNAALQRDVANQIMKLNHDRTMAELDEIREVDRARDDAAKAELSRRDKLAGMLGQLAKQAEDYAKAQGRTTVTIQDITAAQAKLTQEAQASLSSFFSGGAVDPSKLQQAIQFTGQQRQMQQIGATPETVTSAAFGQVSQTYGAGFGYDAAIQAYQRGDIAGGQALQAQAAAQGDVEMAALKTPMDKDVVGKVVDSIGKKGNEVIDSMLMKIPEITTGWMEKFSDSLIRKLEMEAART